MLVVTKRCYYLSSLFCFHVTLCNPKQTPHCSPKSLHKRGPEVIFKPHIISDLQALSLLLQRFLSVVPNYAWLVFVTWSTATAHWGLSWDDPARFSQGCKLVGKKSQWWEAGLCFAHSATVFFTVCVWGDAYKELSKRPFIVSVAPINRYINCING